MYDQEKVLNFARRSEVMSSMDAVECLLDFSKGPNNAVFITTIKKPVYGQFCDRTDTMDSREATTANSSEQPSEPLETQQQPTQQSPSSFPEIPTTISTIESPSTSIKQPRAICNFCGKHFAHLGDYNKHRRRHTGEKPYSCDLCPRTFAHASNLARHRRLHSGEKPFDCIQCGKKFSRKDKLRYHVARCKV